jgi:eukaryotic-like serine/threonine-protein kinase
VEQEKWNRIKALFNAAIELEPSRRAAYLDQACGGDQELRAEVESLLAHHEVTRDPAHQPGSGLTDSPGSSFQHAPAPADQRIGPYRVIREIGHGGMAVVYLALRDDDQYRKRVAVKLVRRGVDDDDILRRFRNERQVLAALDHPNIVKLLDGGSTQQGLPYLVMEYVEGLPIDEYCDNQRLTITERLQLFRTICGAVQYAHQNLIIHRDLKPTNILVTPDGVPKLLDFGIAKLLNPEFSAHTLLVTQPNLRVMTPEYASPEQIRGLPVTTATDVYSLGVVLYELLSGHRPYRLHTHTPLEVERAVCEEEPEKPSTAVSRAGDPASLDSATSGAAETVSRNRENSPDKLRRRLQGDLDNIVLMALRKEPQRRYASVQQLSDDVRRHLEGLPVIARKATLLYRASKFARRNRVAVTAAALIVVALVVGMAVAAWEAHVARQERMLAEARFNDLHQLADSFLFEFDDAVKNLRGSTPARALVVRKALQYLNRLSNESTGDPKLHEDLAHAYIKVGDIQGGPYASNLGDLQGALDSYTKAQQIALALHNSRPNNQDDARLLATAYGRIGGVLLFTGKPQEAINNLDNAVLLLKPLADVGSNQLDTRIDLVSCYTGLGDAYGHGSVLNLGQPAKALEYFRQALTLADNTLQLSPGNLAVLRPKATAESKIGDTFIAESDFDNAIAYHRKSLADFSTIVAADPNNARAKRELTAAYNRLGEALLQHGERAESLALLRKSLAISQDLVSADPTDAIAKFDLAVALRDLSDAQVAGKDLNGAVDNFRRAIELASAVSDADPNNVQRKAQLAEGLISFAQLLTRAGRTDEARHEASRGLAIQRALAASPGVTPGELLAYVNFLLTCQPPQLRDPSAALRVAHQAQRISPDDPDVLEALASAYFATGDAASALAAEQKTLSLVKAHPDRIASVSEQQIELSLKKYRAASGTAGERP